MRPEQRRGGDGLSVVGCNDRYRAEFPTHVSKNIFESVRQQISSGLKVQGVGI